MKNYLELQRHSILRVSRDRTTYTNSFVGNPYTFIKTNQERDYKTLHRN